LIKFDKIQEALEKEDFCTYIGKVKRISGMMIEATGSKYRIGEVCAISTDVIGKNVSAEVVGFNDGRGVYLCHMRILRGIGLENTVKSTRNKLKIPVGDFLIGRVVDAKDNLLMMVKILMRRITVMSIMNI